MGFEGVEKRLIVELSGGCSSSTFRPLDLKPDEWTPILEEAQCAILSQREIDGQKIYLLSESTLAVWHSGFLLKTCGKTSPLKGLSKLIQTYPSLIQQTIWLAYTRVEFAHPEEQMWPHQSFDQEVSYIRQFYPLVEHRTLPAGDQTLHVVFVSGTVAGPPRAFEEILLFGIDERCVEKITGTSQAKSLPHTEGEDQPETKLLGLPFGGGALDEFWFTPQGYSCNAVIKSEYFNCHISPEPETSYASLERGCLEPTPSTTFHLEQFVPPFQPKCAQRTYLQVVPKLSSGRQPSDAKCMICTVTHETGLGENRRGLSTTTIGDTSAT